MKFVGVDYCSTEQAAKQRISLWRKGNVSLNTHQLLFIRTNAKKNKAKYASKVLKFRPPL